MFSDGWFENKYQARWSFLKEFLELHNLLAVQRTRSAAFGAENHASGDTKSAFLLHKLILQLHNSI